MTTAMHDNFTTEENRNPALLRPGTLVYLWAPHERVDADRPTLARVERATAHSIIGVDLRDNARAKYDVGGHTPPGLRWQWDKAADPQRPCLDGGVAFVQRGALDLDQRRRFVFGEPGATVTVFTLGGPPVSGVVTTVMMDGPDPMWIEVSPPENNDPRGRIMHRVRWEHIAAVQQVLRD